MEIFLIASYRSRPNFHPSRVALRKRKRRVFAAPIKKFNPAEVAHFQLDPLWRGNSIPLDYSLGWTQYLSVENVPRFGFRLRFTANPPNQGAHSMKDKTIRVELALLNYFTGSVLQIMKISPKAAAECLGKEARVNLLQAVEAETDIEIIAWCRDFKIVEGQKKTCYSFSRLEKLADPAACSAVMQRYFAASGLLRIDLQKLKQPGYIGHFLYQTLTHVAELLTFCTHAYLDKDLRSSIGHAAEEGRRLVEILKATFLEPITGIQEKSPFKSGLEQNLRTLEKCLELVKDLEIANSSRAVTGIVKGAILISNSYNHAQISISEETTLVASIRSKLEEGLLFDSLVWLDLRIVSSLAFSLYEHHQKCLAAARRPGSSFTKNFCFALVEDCLTFSRIGSQSTDTLKLPGQLKRPNFELTAFAVRGDLVAVRSAKDNKPLYFHVDLAQQKEHMDKKLKMICSSKEYQYLGCPGFKQPGQVFELWEHRALYLLDFWAFGDGTRISVHRHALLSDSPEDKDWVSFQLETPTKTEMHSTIQTLDTAMRTGNRGRNLYVAIRGKQIYYYGLICLEYSPHTNSMKQLAYLWIKGMDGFQGDQFQKSYALTWLESQRMMFSVVVEKVNHSIMVHYHLNDKFVPAAKIAGKTPGPHGVVKLKVDTLVVLADTKHSRWAIFCTRTDPKTKSSGRSLLECFLLHPGF